MTYYYTGVTAYIQHTPESQEAMRILATAIPELHLHINPATADVAANYQNITQSDAFLHLSQNDGLKPVTKAFPDYTPEEYQGVSLSTETIKGIPMTRLHIPVACKNEHARNQFVTHNLVPVLRALFHHQLISVKVKTGKSTDLFHLLWTHTLISANRVA